MTVPSVGIYRTDDHRYYYGGQGPFPSVTTAMKMLDKSDVLMGWAKRETANFAVRNLDVLTAHREHHSVDPSCAPCMKAARPYDGTAAAAKWVATIPDYQSDKARDAGTEIHALAEAIGKGEPTAELSPFAPYAQQYRRFLAEYAVELLAIEYMGINETEGYGGTGDIIGRIGGKVACIDIKSWTKDKQVPDTYYPETAMQLIACSRFEFIGKVGDPTRYPLPKVETYGVLLLAENDYRLIPYFPTDDTYGAFLACLRLYRWRQGEARVVVGKATKEEAA
jgi:hypothetical protein